MRSALVWIVRLCALVGWISAAVACAWLLGATAMARPWHGPLVWGAVAVGCAVVRVAALWVLRGEPADDAFMGEFWIKRPCAPCSPGHCLTGATRGHVFHATETRHFPRADKVT